MANTNAHHTPGPWKWDESWGAVMVDHTDRSKLICPMWTGCDRRGMPAEVAAEDEANARLIAAAPDLLAACEAALSFGEGHPDRTPSWHDARLATQLMLRAAIAKALG